MFHPTVAHTLSLFSLQGPSGILSGFGAGEAALRTPFLLNVECFPSTSSAEGVDSAVSFTKTLGSFSFDHDLYITWFAC